MTTTTASPGTPVDPEGRRVAAALPAAVEAALELAREWAGERLRALVLAGSHASGEAVWCRVDGRDWTLSDLDVYAVLTDEAACREARRRAAAGRTAAAERLAALGVAGPLEVGFLTASGLRRLPARPGTIELARRGRVVRGEAALLDLVPAWTPAGVSREETTLLLENRGFELLIAWPRLADASELARYRARHALLKAAADLASVLLLVTGELPEGTPARVARARERLAPLAAALPLEHQGGARELAALWDAALAWRGGRVELPAPGRAHAEWHAAVRAWSAVWWAVHGHGPREPWARALRVAARAPVRRRARQALLAASRGGATAPLAARLRAALAGTPQHRVNGSGAVLLLAAGASAAPRQPALPAGALRALRVLDVTPATDWAAARSDVVRAWDVWLQVGQRTLVEDA